MLNPAAPPFHEPAYFTGVQPQPGQAIFLPPRLKNMGHRTPLSFQDSAPVYWPTSSPSTTPGTSLTSQLHLPIQMEHTERMGPGYILVTHHSKAPDDNSQWFHIDVKCHGRLNGILWDTTGQLT